MLRLPGSASRNVVHHQFASRPNQTAPALRAQDPDAFYESYPFNVSPVDDDRPFFFYTVQPGDLWSYIFHGNRNNIDYKINQAVPLLFALMAVSIAATALAWRCSRRWSSVHAMPAAAGWNGRCWTGTSRRSTFIAASARDRCRTGSCIARNCREP